MRRRPLLGHNRNRFARTPSLVLVQCQFASVFRPPCRLPVSRQASWQVQPRHGREKPANRSPAPRATFTTSGIRTSRMSPCSTNPCPYRVHSLTRSPKYHQARIVDEANSPSIPVSASTALASTAHSTLRPTAHDQSPSPTATTWSDNALRSDSSIPHC